MQINRLDKNAKAAIRCIWDAKATLGEGPVWVARENSVYWVDIKSNSLFCHSLDGSSVQQTWQLPEQLTSLVPRKGGGFIGTTRHSFATVVINQARSEVFLSMIDSPTPEASHNRFNDGKTDPAGRFWAGSMDDDEQLATGHLYYLDHNRKVTLKDSDYIITNGPAFSPDGSTMYHTDTLSKLIYSFDLSPEGDTTNKKEFIRLSGDEGYPDGMTVDSEGCLWVCLFDGWGINRYSPDGQLIDFIDMPVANITSCTFAGKNLDQLFITTATKGLSKQALIDQPLAGGLFHYQPGVTGLPTPLFNG